MIISILHQEILIVSKPALRKKISHLCAKKLGKIQDLLTTKWLLTLARPLEVKEQGWCLWKEILMILKIQRSKTSTHSEWAEMTQDEEIMFQELPCFLVWKSYANNLCKISKESRVCCHSRDLQWTNMVDSLYHWDKANQKFHNFNTILIIR